MPKPKQSAAQPITDVAKPGKTGADPTAKAVIVTNRQLLQDPMMKSDEPAADVEVVKPSTAPPLSLPKKISIKPLDDDTAKPEKVAEPPVIKTPEEAPALGATGRKVIKPLEESSEAPATEAKPTESDATTVTVTVKKPAVVDSAEPKPTEPVETPAPAAEPDTESPKPEAPATDKPAAPAQPIADVQASKPSQADLPVADTADNSAKTPADDETAAAAAAAKAKQEHEANIQKLVSTQTYFLPINSLEKRRTKRLIALGVLLILLLGVAWTDVAFDAGLIKALPGIPHTHFFTS